MPRSSLFLLFATFFAVLAGAAFVAVLAADAIEGRSTRAAANELERQGHEWAVVEADGLFIRLTGVANSEADRFAALTAAGRVVDPGWIIDRMEVVEPTPPAPDFVVEILRNAEEISIIGLVPDGLDTDHLLSLLASEGARVTDLLESADFPIPSGFETASDFAARATLLLERSKISISQARVNISAAVDSVAAKSRLEIALSRMANDSFILGLDLSAPRPVVTPFSLRFTRGADGAQFDVCTADSDRARDDIRRAAVRAGLTGRADCTIGLGTPSPQWGKAAAGAIEALSEIGLGSVTFSDADVTLIAAAGTQQSIFDRVVGELQTALPEAFSLHAVLTPAPKSARDEFDAPTPEFLATLSPEGQVQLRGRVSNDLMRSAVESFARAQFGQDKVYVATRSDPDLPKGWPVRVLAALDGLSRLHHGSVVVQPDLVSVRGSTGDAAVKADIAQLLSEKLGDAQNFALDVDYEEVLDPLAALPTPQECVERIQAVQQNTKISFDPGKATISEDGQSLIDALAAAWADCEDVPIEVAGHTDSQGRESMNLTLSQTRAEAVIDALLARRVLTAKLLARGYGESSPIADNDTEEGREANRRIEFRLIDDEALADARRAKLAEGGDEEENEQN